jgi:hypothetical protein
MFNILDLIKIVEDVTYKDWDFVVTTNHGVPYLQVQFHADNERQFGRKWLLSYHMTKSEVVSTALKAVLTAEEHEARENFRYKSRRIFGPHFDVDTLVEIAAKKANLDIREKVEI